MVLQQYKKIEDNNKKMGCGQICGASLSIVQISRETQIKFMKIIKQIIPNKYLYPIKSINNIINQIKCYPEKFNLILTDKLTSKYFVSINIMEKWKIILFCIDSNITSYVNCLGYSQMVQCSQVDKKSQQEQQTKAQKPQTTDIILQNIEILKHKAFIQIEKDIERTFPGYNFQKKSFTTVLQRITNHFPIMGYTQGINFIVGFLLIIGYSEIDAFWLFVHMAINRRYLLLGLYQDGFPLINVYMSIFRNMLKRLNEKLYRHLYEKVQMFDESAWIFKWFMTCYLCSFPLEMCKYVWDFVLCTNGLGFIKFAISLITHLQKHLLKIDDAYDLTQFLSNLKQITIFNTYLSIKDIIKNLQKIHIIKSDLNDLNNNNNINFYSQYILLKFQQDSQDIFIQSNTGIVINNNQIGGDQGRQGQNGGKQSINLLNNWYNKLIQQRRKFRIQSQKNSKIQSQKNPKIQPKINQNSNQIYGGQQQVTISFAQSSREVVEIVDEDEQKIAPNIQKSKRISLDQFDSLQGYILDQKPNKKQQKQLKQQKYQLSQQIKTTYKTKQKILTNSNRYGQIKLSTQIISNNNNQQQQQIQQSKDKIQIQDTIPKQTRQKRRYLEKQSNDILSQFTTHFSKCKQNNIVKCQNKFTQQKVGSVTDVAINMQKSRLAKAGNSVVSSMSASVASGRSSASSHKTTQKENSIGNSRACKCAKNKIEENNLEALPEARKYLRGTRKPQQIQEHQSSIQNIQIHSVRKRVNTSHDWMANNSDIPMQSAKNMIISNIRNQQQIVSQVQIPNVWMFKKKNKIKGIDTFQVMHHCQNIIQQQISQCHSRVQNNPAMGQEQSIQSVFIGNNSERKSEVCDIHSVK